MLTDAQIKELAKQLTMLSDTPWFPSHIARCISAFVKSADMDPRTECPNCKVRVHRPDAEHRTIQQALIQILAGQRETSRKLDELLNLNRHSHGEHCHREAITMKGVFTVTFTVEPGAPPPLAVASPEDLGEVGGPLQVPALEISGGTPPYKVALDPSSGPLPPGVAMDESGNLTGSPTEAGSFDVVVDVSDSLETAGSQPAAAAKAPSPGFGPAHGQ